MVNCMYSAVICIVIGVLLYLIKTKTLQINQSTVIGYFTSSLAFQKTLSLRDIELQATIETSFLYATK